MGNNLVLLRGKVELAEASRITHLARLAAVENNGMDVLSNELKTLANESNFVWFITADNVRTFKYHANVRRYAIRSNEMPVKYIGDIPEFALDRAETAIRLGMRYITVHSMQPLPTDTGDPIMIGWFSMPLTVGVVLAVWNNEKELEI